ncbi:MAG TPA: histidine kinase, partial [Candidatus Hydrogenedentes bacterium]|nr:histidine kinase [Candidatus Hydrogenedentota bacterium]
SEMCLPYTIERLRETIENLAISNEALAKTQETLMQAEKLASMGQLAAGIAHELNNPLGVVLMYAHILEQEQENNPALMEDLTMIKEQADRCKKIVSGLLHFARQNKVSRRGTDLRELIDRSLKTVVIPDNVTVTVEHNVDDPVADLDDDQIMQALCNLIGNACAAMPDGGRLAIQTMGNNNRVELRVCDTGPGIPKEHADKIFEPFFTTKPYGKGTGLGLAITYGIVKMHSGDIRVESNTDPRMGPTGATFIISLPRHAALAPAGQSGF